MMREKMTTTLTTTTTMMIKDFGGGAWRRKTTLTTTTTLMRKILTTMLLREEKGGGGGRAFSSSQSRFDFDEEEAQQQSEGGVVQTTTTTTTTIRDEEDDASPPHPAEFLLNQPLKLYRDCLRLADYLAFKQSVPRFALREQVKHVWRKNQFLTDANEIRTAREAAVRGLSNSMMHFATENLDVENSNKRAFLDEEEDEEKETK